jgi:hypothetical protein
MREVSPSQLASVISNYNSTTAGKPTPAGQALIASGLMTPAQLAALGGVAETLGAPPADPAGNGWLHLIDMKAAFPIKIGERFTIEPSISAYNVFNFANFNISPSYTLSSVLDQSNGSVNGTPKSDPRNTFRATQTSSLFGTGAPRQFEWGLRVVF